MWCSGTVPVMIEYIKRTTKNSNQLANGHPFGFIGWHLLTLIIIFDQSTVDRCKRYKNYCILNNIPLAMMVCRSKCARKSKLQPIFYVKRALNKNISICLQTYPVYVWKNRVWQRFLCNFFFMVQLFPANIFILVELIKIYSDTELLRIGFGR